MDQQQPPEHLASELRALREEVAAFQKHRFLRAHDSYRHMIFYNFVRGLALGLGTVMGATILVSIAVYVLTQIQIVPVLGDLVGDWAKDLAFEIDAGRAGGE